MPVLHLHPETGKSAHPPTMRIPTRRHEVENNSMTPMIDVIFQLLIFFVCASAGQTLESHLPTELAAGTTESAVISPAPKSSSSAARISARSPGASQSSW